MQLLQQLLILSALLYLCVAQSSQAIDIDDRWKHSVIYEIFLQSFKDSNADGIGDLNGLTEQLSYLAETGVDYLWVTPFFQSPSVDNGYEVTNYTDILTAFGTMADFERLMREMKKHDLKFIMDLVINHSSEKHVWFEKSIKRQDPYADYYVWHDPKAYDKDGTPIQPNNWVSVFGGSAWTWNEDRKQFYLHQFTGYMPDFNLTNPTLMKELTNVMKFWLDKGIDGFRLDAAKHFVEDDRFLDEPYASKEAAEAEVKQLKDLIHIYTFDQPQTFEVIRHIRDLLHEYSAADGRSRIIFVEATPNGPGEQIKEEYYNVSHFPINFSLRFDYKPNFLTSRDLYTIITSTIQNLPQGAVPNWVTDCHDWIRSTNRFGPEVGNALVMLAATLPGIYITYYGQEIGMEEPILRPDQCINGDPSCLMFSPRTPMQWNDNYNSGFSQLNKPWLPVNTNYWRVNVEREVDDIRSQYSLFKRLMRLRRRTAALLHGQTNCYVLSDWIFVLVRYIEHDKSCIVFVVNLGSETESVRIDSVPDLYSELMIVMAVSENSEHYNGEVCYRNVGFVMRPKSAVLLDSSH